MRAVPNVPNAAVPARSSRTAPTDIRAASTAASAASACGRSARPASVGTRPRPTRWKSAHAELGLEPADLLGERRLREVQRLRGGAERAVLEGREDVLELLQRHIGVALRSLKTIKATAGAHKGRSCTHAHSCLHPRRLRAVRGARPASWRRVAPWLRRTPRACAPGATSDISRGAGVALCLASACGFGLMAIFAKEAYAAGLGVTALLAARFVLAASLLWAIVAVRARRRAAAGAGPAPRRPARPAASSLAGLALGAIGYAAQAGLFFSALRHIDASLTSLLLYTYPALVFCGAVALRPRARHAVEGARARARQRGRRARAARRRDRRPGGDRRRARARRGRDVRGLHPRRRGRRGAHRRVPARRAHHDGRRGDVPRRGRRRRRAGVPGRRLALDRRDRARSRRSCRS